MYFKTKSVIIILISTLLPIQVNADNFSTGPLCYKPSKPLLFAPKYLKRRFEKDTDEYKSCIQLYIAEQERAIQLHKDSIVQAGELLKQ